MIGRNCLMLVLSLTAFNAGLANEPAKVSAGQQHAEAAVGEKATSEPKVEDTTETGGDPFCDRIVDDAREQRYFLKQQELKALLDSVNERVELLDKKKAEYEEWVKRREDFASRATANLVEIYGSMKPEASAARLAELESDLAASLLLAIAPRKASTILNEMDEKTAASLTSIMAASARKKDPS